MADESDRQAFLDRIDVDSRTNLTIMRWIRFLTERTEPEALSELFRYYNRIGWIGDEVEAYLVAVANGTKPSEQTFDQDEREKEVEDHELLVVKKRPQRKPKKDEDSEEVDWRLDPDDHIRSWMFIMEIAGVPADKNLWCDLGQRLDRFEGGLDEFCRI